MANKKNKKNENEDKEKGISKMSINWEERANAKLPKSVLKWTLNKLNIFRNLIKLNINLSIDKIIDYLEIRNF